MSTITSTGVGSGLDVSTIVSSLMTLERRPLEQMQQRASGVQARLSAFGTLKGLVSAFGDVATQLTQARSWNPMKAESSQSTAVTATATADAKAATHAITVSQLARPQVLASGNYASATTPVGSGSLRIEFGTTGAGTFQADTARAAMVVAIGAGTSSLAGIRDAINAANGAARASLVNGPDGARLVLRGPDGAAASMRITVTDDDGNPTDGAGLSALAFDPALPVGSAGRNLEQTQAAQDALFTIDGLALRSATNAPADVLPGVTLQLRQVTTEPAQLTLAVETMAVRKNVNDFINAYNALNRQLNQQLQADPSGKTRGALQADSTAVSLHTALRSVIRGSVSGSTGASTLVEAGIELQSDGSLSLNETRLSAALADPRRLQALFGSGAADSPAATQGIGWRVRQWTRAQAADAGVLPNRMDDLKRSIDRSQREQDREQARLERTEARLRAQYQRLDSQMTQLNAEMKRMNSALGIQ